MFWSNFKNCIKVIFRAKITIFWTLIFPIALASFMYASFGSMENEEMFKDIDVAVVSEGNAESELMYVLEVLSDGEDKLLNIKEMNDEDAVKALSENTVKGIIYVDEERLMVNESSANASILEGILNSYKQNKYVITDLLGNMKTPADEATITALINEAFTDISYYTESSPTNNKQNLYNNYFYAIFAMSCLFAAFSAVGDINSLQANASGMGMRKCISPNSKILFIVSEFAALVLVQFVVEIIAFAYMKFILRIDFGEKTPAIILTLFVGCMMGIAIGIIIGAISKLSLETKMGMVVAISLVLSGMSDLFVNGIKRAIEVKLPIINRINPAALISDCFYYLNVYEDYSLFTRNIVILSAESFVLIVIAFIMIRRNKYASI